MINFEQLIGKAKVDETVWLDEELLFKISLANFFLGKGQIGVSGYFVGNDFITIYPNTSVLGDFYMFFPEPTCRESSDGNGYSLIEKKTNEFKDGVLMRKNISMDVRNVPGNIKQFAKYLLEDIDLVDSKLYKILNSHL